MLHPSFSSLSIFHAGFWIPSRLLFDSTSFSIIWGILDVVQDLLSCRIADHHVAREQLQPHGEFLIMFPSHCSGRTPRLNATCLTLPKFPPVSFPSRSVCYSDLSFIRSSCFCGDEQGSASVVLPPPTDPASDGGTATASAL